MESTGGREGDEWLGQTMLFVNDQVVLSFSLSLFSLVSRSMEIGDGRWKGLEMDDALPQKRWKKELYTYLYLYLYLLYLSVLFFSEPTQYQHFHVIIIIQGCVNEVMIEFFRSHVCCWWISLLHTVDLTWTVSIHSSTAFLRFEWIHSIQIYLP